MKYPLTKYFSLSLICILSVACSTQTATQAQYSGFLGDYSQLTKTTSATGHDTLRWVAPNVPLESYTSLIYDPIVYYPQATPTARVDTNTLNMILDYTNQQVKTALSQRLPLTTTRGKHTLIFKGAITAVNAENEGVQFYEVLPVTAIIAGTMAASGHRTQESALFFEAEFVDSETGQPVLKVVRKGYGRDLNNSQTPIKESDVKQVIDNMVTDITRFEVK